MTYYAVTGSGKRFRNIEDAEVFRLDQVKKTGRIDLRVRKVRAISPGQTVLICYGGETTPSLRSQPSSGSGQVHRESVFKRIKRMIQS